MPHDRTCDAFFFAAGQSSGVPSASNPILSLSSGSDYGRLEPTPSECSSPERNILR